VKPTTATRGLLAATLCALLAAASSASAGSTGALSSDDASRAPVRKIVKTKRVAPGLLFTTIVEKKLPLRTFVLRMDPSKAVTFDVALARDTLPGRRTVRAVAKAANAIAATNGDFGNPQIGRPTHPMLVDNQLVQTASQIGPLFAVRRDEQAAFLGKPPLEITATEVGAGTTLTVDRWNQGPPTAGELVAYSPIGGTLEAPPDYQCSARLERAGRETPDGGGIVQDFTVAETGCPFDGMGRQDGIVLSAAPATDEATHLLAMPIGETVRLRWSFGWNASDVVGGMPILVQNGRGVATSCSTAFCGRNPRTAIGWTGNGHLLLVVVDGRRPKWSQGATLNEMAQIMRDLGAVEALNLDGGGSSTMVVRGEVVNKPSDDRERLLTNAVLILPGPDRGEDRPASS
jgi:hypothetical protein